jgi:L-fuconolactonase
MISPDKAQYNKIDVHQHFWRYVPSQYKWISDEMEILKKDYLPPDLGNHSRDTGYKSSITVQARQTREETEWLLSLAADNPGISGVVGWLDLCSSEIESDISSFTGNPCLKGLRHVLHDEPDDNFMLRPDFLRGISGMEKTGLVYELLIFPVHLPNAIKLAGMFPGQEFILDHCAKPDIRNRKINEWSDLIKKLARFPNVSCKVSGLVTEANWQGWKPDDIYPYFEVIWHAFGEERLMIGSDWPVCLLAATYPQVVCLAEGYFEKFGTDALGKITTCNAKRIYNL